MAVLGLSPVCARSERPPSEESSGLLVREKQCRQKHRPGLSVNSDEAKAAPSDSHATIHVHA